MIDDASSAGYVVPTYREPDHTPWYHFLHGNVPGHQIDFMYRAEVPQGPLTRQHFSHLARLMKYIEPQAGCPYAFAIGNLSRDDTQHEPGHGGVALMFGLRIQGITDHAGRQDPPFAHAVAAIDRDLDRTELLAAAGVFHRHVLAAAQSADWYRRYVRCAAEAPEGMASALAEYVADFSDLPSPPPSSMGLKWTVGESTPAPRIVIVHDDDAPFGAIAACAAKIAAVLFPSDIRWSAISNGREADLPNGVTVRLVAASNVTPADEARGVHRIEEIPDDEEEIAQQLFGAWSTTAVAKPVARGWRDKYAGANTVAEEGSVDLPRSSVAGEAPVGRKTPPPAPPAAPEFDVAATRVWDRAGPGIEVHDEIEIDVDRTSVEGAAPSSPPSTRHLASVNPSADVAAARLSPISSAASDRSAIETRTIPADEVRASLKAALPFMPVSAPHRTAPASEREPGPDFRRSSVGWKGPVIGLSLVVTVLVVAYVVLGSGQQTPAPEQPPLPTSAGSELQPTSVPAPTVAPTATVAEAPTSAPTASAAPPASAAPTPSVGKKAPALTPSVKPPKPSPGHWKPKSSSGLDDPKLD